MAETSDTQRARTRPNWALLCGAIRSKLEFDVTLNAALDLRQKGLLDGIVVSTWHDAFKDHPDLRGQLGQAGVHVVSVPQIREGGNGNSYRQHRLVAAALDVCPDGSAVLKMRSDKCVHRLRYFTGVLKRGLMEPPATAPAYRLFRYKLAVMTASLTMPFSNSDVVFYGLKEDIRSLLHIDMTYDWVFFPGSANAEIRWFSRPFLDRIKTLRSYFEYFNCRLVSGHIIDRFAAGEATMLPAFLNDMLAANLLVIHENFELVSDIGTGEKISAQQLFTGEHPRMSRLIPITNAKHILAFSDRVVTDAVARELADDPSNAGLYAALTRMQDPAYRVRDFGPDELRGIREACFPDDPAQPHPSSHLRFATNIYPPADAPTLDSLPVGTDVLAGLPADAQAFALGHILEACATTALEVIYYDLALLYRAGVEVEQSDDIARFWLQQSAENRYRPAQADYAAALEAVGDFDKAAFWFHQAAITGDAAAQLKLAELLRDHEIESVQDDWRHWMEKATKNGAGTENLPE